MDVIVTLSHSSHVQALQVEHEACCSREAEIRTQMSVQGEEIQNETDKQINRLNSALEVGPLFRSDDVL